MTGYKSKRAAAQDKITDEQGRPMTYWGGKEQPEQEPDWKGLVLAHNAECDERCDKERCGYAPYFEANGRRCPTCPVYEKIDVDTPPQRKPLTIKQEQKAFEKWWIKEIGDKDDLCASSMPKFTPTFYSITRVEYAWLAWQARAIEAAHGIKEKNT